MVIKLNYKIIVAIVMVLLIVLISAIFVFYYVDANTSSFKSKGEICLPIIMYHQVKYTQLGKDTITPEEFEADLNYLKENNYTTINMKDLIDYVYNDTDLPENPIMLTFDDGYLTTYKYVFPLLQKYDMKMVLSIIGKGTDDFSKVEDTNLNHSHMTWNQVKEVSDSGYIEIQNHTYNLHANKGRTGCLKKKNETLAKYERILSEDLGALQEKITKITGMEPTTFVYPFGQSSKNTDEILIKLGFKASLNCGGRLNYITKNPNDLFGLTRIRRGHGKSISKLI